MVRLPLLVVVLRMLAISNANLSNGIKDANVSPSNANLGYPSPYLGQTSPGSVWPEPQQKSVSPQIFAVDVTNFAFKMSGSPVTCDIITAAFERYGMLFNRAAEKVDRHYTAPIDTIGSLQVTLLAAECEQYPSLDMNEAYELTVENPAKLEAGSVWGVLRGLETFSQLMYKGPNGMATMNKTMIVDYPRFKHRGILLDTSRHYLHKDVIKMNLEAMAYNKFNVFHWHIVDIQSFPYVSKLFPDLSAKGAYNPGSSSHVYSPSDVQEIIEFARLRGIRVLPEFDTPGHTSSWGPGQPGLLTPCYSDNKPDGTFGPINPTIESNYDFIRQLFTELRGVFKDSYIHLGGDEVNFNCWKSNPNVNAWMKARNMTTYNQLEQYYIQKVLNISGEIGYSYAVWQEVIDNGVKVNLDTLVEVWKRGRWQESMSRATALGLHAILTANWYMNRITLGPDWKNFYQVEPTNFNGTAAQKALVIGGEACLWGEFVDATNLTPRLWPRASAVAERLWSAQSVNSTTLAGPRLHQHRCRMMNRGIPAEPIFPSYCEKEWYPF